MAVECSDRKGCRSMVLRDRAEISGNAFNSRELTDNPGYRLRNSHCVSALREGIVETVGQFIFQSFLRSSKEMSLNEFH